MSTGNKTQTVCW